MPSSILRVLGYCPRIKVHPEIIKMKDYEQTDKLDLSSHIRENESVNLQRKDPCAQMYERYKEPGAYDQYSKMLSSNRI